MSGGAPEYRGGGGIEMNGTPEYRPSGGSVKPSELSRRSEVGLRSQHSYADVFSDERLPFLLFSRLKRREYAMTNFDIL